MGPGWREGRGRDRDSYTTREGWELCRGGADPLGHYWHLPGARATGLIWQEPAAGERQAGRRRGRQEARRL